MNSYYLSNGTKMSKAAIDRKIATAKREFWKEQELTNYIHCHHCKRIDKDRYDVSHIISVNDCQRQKKTELAWSFINLEILCRQCHIKHENKSKFD